MKKSNSFNSKQSLQGLKDEISLNVNDASSEYRLGDRPRRTGMKREHSLASVSFTGEQEFDAANVNSNSEWEFTTNHVGLTQEEAEARLFQFGRNELPDNSKSKLKIFLELIIQPMACMIWMAAAVEGAIQNWPDMSILIAINLLNSLLSFYETIKAGDAVAALKASLRPVATVKRDGQWKNIDGSEIVPGDLILLAAGSSICADARINDGQLEVDQSALTGESLPVTLVAGDPVNHPKMGSTCVKGEVEATVEHTGVHTLMGQTAALLGTGDTISNLQKILIKIILVLVACSITLSAICFAWGFHKGTPLKENLGFTVVLIVASIPLAVEIVTTTTLALGSKELSKHGAIVSRLSSIEDLAGMDMLCSDKTGTLTTNHMEMQDEAPSFMKGMGQAEIVQFAAMAAKWKEPPRDALDTLVLGAADIKALDAVVQDEYIPFDPTLKRTEATVTTAGETFKVTKGAPHVVIDLCTKTEEEHAYMEEQQLQLAQRGIRSLMIAKTNAADEWKAVGMLSFLDPARPDSRDTIAQARKMGVPVKMITGDHFLIGKEMARSLDMDGKILGPERLPLLNDDGSIPKNLVSRYGRMVKNAGGFAQVFPQHKYLIVHCLRNMGYKVGMTGDGVNDAPALKAADVGIAVSGATDAARLAADIVLTEPGLYTIIHGIRLARKIFQRIYNFLIYRIAASLQLLFFFFVAVLALSPAEFAPKEPSFTGNPDDWKQEFKMPVLLLMLITLLNDGTLISIGYDNVTLSPRPCVWNLKVVFCISIILGLVACGSSLALLYAALDSWNPNGVWQKIGLHPLAYGQITTMIYLKVSVSDFLTLFSARGGEGFFFSIRPAPILVGAGAFALGLSTALACLWPKTELDNVRIEGLTLGDEKVMAAWVWVYSIIVWFFQDLIKVLTYKFLRSTSLLGINDKTIIDDSKLQAYSSNNPIGVSVNAH